MIFYIRILNFPSQILLAPHSLTSEAIGADEHKEIYKMLLQKWGSDSSIDWIAISANVFDIRPTTSSTMIAPSMEI